VTALVIAGGWGYENLGDEAILAGYLEFLYGRTDLRVASSNPNKTLRAQRGFGAVIAEGRKARAEILLIGGGGYLNGGGGWKPEIVRKLWDLHTMARGKVVGHALEVRCIHGAIEERLFRSIFDGPELSVRDLDSKHEVRRLVGSEPDPPVVPDAIALLAPHLDRYGGIIRELQGKIVLNFLDFPRRPDSHEAEVNGGHWAAYVRELSRALGDNAVGLIMGAGDRRFLQWAAPTLPLLEPASVADLVSALRSARGVVSARMHPALLASALGTPAVSIPYCGKVTPTLRRIGVDDQILRALDVEMTLDLLSAQQPRHADAWLKAHDESGAWLERSLGLS
jgi:hypothetical protein